MAKPTLLERLGCGPARSKGADFIPSADFLDF